MKNFIAGVANVDIFSGEQLIANARTLLDSSISLASTAEELRAGQGNALWGKYYHTSTFDINLTEAMFKLEYIALQTGSIISTGSDVHEQEQVSLSAGGVGTIAGTPIEFGTFGIIGWVSKAGTDDWIQVNFVGNTFTIPGGQEGDIYCVKFVSKDTASRKIVVASNFIPDTVKLIMSVNLYAGDVSLGSTNTRVGRVQIEVPRFQFSGVQEISMTAAGIASTPLAGTALSNSSIDCSDGGYYAIITEQLFNANWYDNVFDLAIAGGDVELTVGGTSSLVVRAINTSGGTTVANNANLTFTSRDPDIATVNSNGIVSGVGTGSTVITAVITAKPTVEGIASITVM